MDCFAKSDIYVVKNTVKSDICGINNLIDSFMKSLDGVSIVVAIAVW